MRLLIRTLPVIAAALALIMTAPACEPGDSLEVDREAVGGSTVEHDARASTPTAASTGWAPHGKAPLVILISLDTVRADGLGLYGYERFTSPTLDVLATESTVFDDASTTAPWTLPSHASMLTGLYPVSHYVLTPSHIMPLQIPTLAGTLAAAGFTTAAVVNSGWLKKENYFVTRDFEKYLYVEEDVHRTSPSTWVTDQALTWLAERKSNEPTFLFMHYYDAHADYASQSAYEKLFAEPYDGDVKGTALELMNAHIDPVYQDWCQKNFNEASCVGQHVHKGLRVDESFERQSFSAADVRHLRNLYDAGVRQLDTELGRLFGSLRESGDLDRALVFIVADHGEEFGEHGQTDHLRTQYQEVVRIPFLMRGPGVPRGVRFETPVSLVDIAPTILAYAGLEPQAAMDGLDLSLLWRDGDATGFASRLIFQDAGYGGGAAHNIKELKALAPRTTAVRKGRFKLYYDKRADPRYVLFDLEADPGETHDASADHPELRAELEAVLEARHAATAEWESAAPTAELSPEDKARLRALGYMN